MPPGINNAHEMNTPGINTLGWIALGWNPLGINAQGGFILALGAIPCGINNPRMKLRGWKPIRWSPPNLSKHAKTTRFIQLMQIMQLIYAINFRHDLWHAYRQFHDDRGRSYKRSQFTVKVRIHGDSERLTCLLICQVTALKQFKSRLDTLWKMKCFTKWKHFCQIKRFY